MNVNTGTGIGVKLSTKLGFYVKVLEKRPVRIVNSFKAVIHSAPYFIPQ